MQESERNALLLKAIQVQEQLTQRQALGIPLDGSRTVVVPMTLETLGRVVEAVHLACHVGFVPLDMAQNIAKAYVDEVQIELDRSTRKP